ncbi:hypothetical protein GYMLUDRAFT_78233 [Collybiopsis luxurians FD-317 M1]|uniref:Uncharacterized protein n=1 Tax=Collybiopsis luxurians FD-317 M1 TaxID=944289 RepID=A0A0D0BP59_9AGAR|nr:hypothetical protein GYMLUDRAFT_78233 [Collybiopsis luxurians FD-317 M1]
MGQLSLEKTLLIAPYVEVRFFLAIFSATMYGHFSPTFNNTRTRVARHTNTMIGISSLMFVIATMHLALNAARTVAGYVDHGLTPGGPVAFIAPLRPWDHVLKDTLYATQESLGSTAAIYRCWVLWNRNWKVIVIPVALLVVEIVAGYMVCGLYVTSSSTTSIFDPQLITWITTFYSFAVGLNIVTTSLMSYRIWSTHRQSSAYKANNNSRLLSILRILIESAALQLIVEIVLLALYCSDINAQFILLESVASVVGITFNAIAIRIRFQVMETSTNGPGNSTGGNPTFGSVPLRPIQVNISRDVEENMNDDTLTFDHTK